MPQTTPSIWDEAMDAWLRARWESGASAATIGRERGLTKNQVIGRAHRLKLTARPSPVAKPAGSMKAMMPPRSTRQTPAASPFRARPIAPPAPKASALPVSARSFRPFKCYSETGGPQKCQFPLWGDTLPRPPRFCGEKVANLGCPYCREHAEICFRPKPEERP